jgi:DNA invertase Pin-like site-specific DNA recombinase
MSRPFAYLRKSSVRDPARDTSPDTQEREIRALAARHGDEIVADAMLADWDVSGRAEFTPKRTGYHRLFGAVDSGECAVVYSYSLSRLGRSTAELAKLFDLCAARKVPVRLVVDSVDTSTASGRMLANILASVAQFEAEVASERTRASYETRRERAISEGRDPVEAVRSSPRYGDRPADDPAAVLAAYRETGSFSKAAALLNRQGVKPRDAAAWWASSVGVVVARLDPEVRGRRSSRGVKLASSEGFALARLLRCGTCGHMLTGSRLPDGKGGRRTRYACRFAEGADHPRVSISEHLILPDVEAEAALYRDPDENDIAAIERRRRTLLERRGRVLRALFDGVAKRDEANAELREMDLELARMDAPPPRDLRLVTAMTPREVNAILRDLFESIDVDANTFRPIAFRWRNSFARDEA